MLQTPSDQRDHRFVSPADVLVGRSRLPERPVADESPGQGRASRARRTIRITRLIRRLSKLQGSVAGMGTHRGLEAPSSPAAPGRPLNMQRHPLRENAPFGDPSLPVLLASPPPPFLTAPTPLYGVNAEPSQRTVGVDHPGREQGTSGVGGGEGQGRGRLQRGKAFRPLCFRSTSAQVPSATVAPVRGSVGRVHCTHIMATANSVAGSCLGMTGTMPRWSLPCLSKDHHVEIDTSAKFPPRAVNQLYRQTPDPGTIFRLLQQ